MQQLLAVAARVGTLLKARGETVAVSESSTGGLVSAALLAAPGASAFFVGGAVVYTVAAREALLAITQADMAGMRSATQAYASLAARRVRERHGAAWGLAETGAAGPSGNRYGDAAGHCCFAADGPGAHRAGTLETGSADRWQNMLVFGEHVLLLLEEMVTGSTAA